MAVNIDQKLTRARLIQPEPFLGIKNTKKLELFSRQFLDQPQIWQRGLFLGPGFRLMKNFHVRRHFDVTMTKSQITHISETEKVYGVNF